MLSYVPNHSKHSQTTKVIKWRWIASIWRQNDQKCLVTSQTIQNNSNLQKYSNYNELHRFDVKNIKQRKTTKVIKLRWSAWIWRQNEQKCWVTSQTIQNNSNLQKYSNYNELHRFDVKNIKQRKTTKVIKLRRSAWIWRQNEQKCWVTSETIQNNANLQKLSKYNELHRFDVKTIKNVELRPKPFQTQSNYKSDQITMNCIDLTSKRSKMFSYVPNHSKQLKPTKVFKLQWTASIWCQKHQTTQNYKSDQITMKCMDLTSKRTKMLSYVANHSKQLKPSKVFKLQWIASIWCQKHQTTQNYKSDQITTKCMDLTSKRTKMFCYVGNHWKQRKSKKVIKYNELHRFDVKTIKNVELRPKPFKTTQTYKSIQITMNCIDLMSKTSNNAKLQKWSNYDEVHGFDVKMNKNVELRRKPFKTTQTYKSIKLQWTASIWCQKHQTTQNYKSDQITTKCMDLTSKRTKMLSYVGNHSKQRKSTKVIKLRWIASIWRQNDQKCWVTSQTIQNNSNLQKYSNYNELHRFDVKNIKQRKTTKVIKLRWSAWIWRQSEQKCFVTSETIENNANLQKLSKYNELHRFDVKTIKNVELRPKPFQTQQTTKVIKYDELHRFDVKTIKNV